MSGKNDKRARRMMREAKAFLAEVKQANAEAIRRGDKGFRIDRDKAIVYSPMISSKKFERWDRRFGHER